MELNPVRMGGGPITQLQTPLFLAVIVAFDKILLMGTK